MPSTTQTTHTATIVVFADDDDGLRHVLLVTHALPPFKGHRALPGGFVELKDFAATRDPRVASRNAAARGGGEEAGITVRPSLLRFLGTWDTGSDPRGDVATDAYTAVLPFMPRASAGRGVAAAEWMPLHHARLEPLVVDGNRILGTACTPDLRTGAPS